MTDLVWLEKALLLALYDDVVVATGGASGLRDEALLDSALARPANLLAYRGDADICELAAAYAVGIASNHPFLDGNKRMAFMALGLFLEENGLTLMASDEDATETMLAVARGDIMIEALAAWLRTRTRQVSRD